MIDSVWTSDHHPSLCGTAKFSHQLARRLGVPVNAVNAKHPLISVRASEIDAKSLWPPRGVPYDVFLHDWWNTDGTIATLVHFATHVYAANEDIAKDIRTIRPDVVTLWAPSTIEGNAHRGTINVLTFGMAHKIQPAKYEKLKTLLDATGEDYTVSVSTAIHEGSPWDETAHVGDKLRAIFGDRLRVLGYLADDALVAEMARCTAIAVFYDPALRANNTSFWAAMDATPQRIITNLDADSPSLPDWPYVYDIDAMTPGHWRDPDEPTANRSGEAPSWSGLLNIFQGQPCAK